MKNYFFEYVGILGKRTKFQKRDIAQLTLKVNTDKFRALTINDCEWSHLPKVSNYKFNLH